LRQLPGGLIPFEPGPFIEETDPSKTVHFVGTEAQLRF
jgi:hypothetical protein